MSEAQPHLEASAPADRSSTKQRSVRNRDLSALLAVAEVATQSLDIEETLNGTLDKSLEMLGFEVGFIRILDQEKAGMVVRAARGLHSPEFLRGIAPIHSERRNVSRIVFETKQSFVCGDIRKNSNYKQRFMEREGLISTAAAPLLSKNRVLGIIVVGSRRSHRFQKREIDLLQAFGSLLGAALDNAELYQQVNKSKAYVENLVENAPDSIICTDLEDKILSWNRGAEVLFGYSKSETIGKHLSILLPPERFHELEEMRAKVQLSGPLRNIEVTGKRKDGVIIFLSLSVAPIKDTDETIVGFLRIAKDITEKKRYERRLKELDKIKSDFVSNVSHELRTPLTAIKGSLDNMLDGITGPLTEKQMRYLARMKSNADRLGRLISDLLDLSKIEAGKVDLRPANLAVNLLITEVVEALRPVAREKFITLDVVSSDEKIQAWGDRDKVVQILMNLIGNAVKFTPVQGEVKIVIQRRDAQWVKLSVADSGPGIPAEEAAKIFDKFYQIAQADRQKTKGTGLGLTISKALVEMHGGEIWIESGIGKGCVFSFTLPVRQPAEPYPHRELLYGFESTGG